ncbi:Asr1405/Asl0597 family protein [Phormidesmis sp. 146-35]
MKHSQPAPGQILQISRGDRWIAHYRLQELSITCTLTSDGFLRVDVNNLTDILQVRSVIQQLTAPRQTLTQWLDRCWSIH